MQGPRMLPLLISILAIPISLFAATMPDVIGMLCIMVLLLAMFSAVQAIILADAGVKASAENTAAVINTFMGNLVEKKPAYHWPSRYAFDWANVSRQKIFSWLHRTGWLGEPAGFATPIERLRN